jgi:hypothetical protein
MSDGFIDKTILGGESGHGGEYFFIVQICDLLPKKAASGEEFLKIGVFGAKRVFFTV